jgi:predicted NBD/HSP70 family sugar kinase
MLRLILRNPGLPRASLVDKMELTQQSVHRIATDLAARGLVTLGPAPPAASRGKPSPSITLNAGFGYTWGISINTDEVGLSVVDFACNLIVSELFSSDRLSRDATLDLILTRMQVLRRSYDLPEDRCMGAGFGISGFRIGGTSFNPPLPLRQWAAIELGPLLASHFRLPVWIENNANTSALGEVLLGLGREIKTFGYISFNYGLGGSVIIDGKLQTGGRQNAGEVSALFTSEERQHRPALQFLFGHLKEHGVEIASVADMAERFDPSWPGVEDWVDQVSPNFNRIIAAFWAILDPEAVVLGGQIHPALAKMLIGKVRLTEIDRYGISRPTPEVRISTLGPHASSIGAAAYAIDHCCF